MIPTGNDRYVAVSLQNTALGTPATNYTAAPVSGTVRMIFVTFDTAVDADNIVSTAIAGTAITGGGYTITAATSVAGTVKTLTPTAANTVARGQALSFITDGGGSAGACRVTFLIEQF